MTDEVKPPPPAPPSFLPPPKRWRPDAIARLMLANADRYRWVWVVAERNDGGLDLIASQLPAGALDRILRAAVQEASKTGAPPPRAKA